MKTEITLFSKKQNPSIHNETSSNSLHLKTYEGISWINIVESDCNRREVFSVVFHFSGLDDLRALKAELEEAIDTLETYENF